MDELTGPLSPKPNRPASARIDEICDEFESAWQSGAHPQIEQYLEKVDESDRHDLLRELLCVELFYRRQAEQMYTVDDYLARFPNDFRVVNEAFRADAQWRVSQNQSPSIVSASGSDSAKRQTVGRFILQRELGRGGSGEVHLALDSSIDRYVAIKLPRQDIFTSNEAAAKFLDEARKAAQLDHPGIVPIYEVGEVEGLRYIVQKYIDGGNLETMMASQDISLARIVELLLAIVDAVGYAHQAGLIHRDLKPANILVDQHGKPYVADFGLAVRAESRHSRGREIAGTPYYMSLEQLRGETNRITARTDVWSMGVILYRLLTGQLPFRASTLESLEREIEQGELRSPRELRPDIPVELQRICIKCLAKRSLDRYASMADLADDLRFWKADDPVLMSSTTAIATTAGSSQVVPRGLRSFGKEDQHFYLSLLPGPKDREGLPETISFWKKRIEELDADATFSVGVIYGPSGSGKSSLLKAGLLPRIGSHVTTIHLESTRRGTETNIVRAIHKRFPTIPVEQVNRIPELFAYFRDSGPPDGEKVLVVLDQFEQWLHSQNSESSRDLIAALRHCDGRHIQVLLAIRDDFWMSITEFMERNLEIPIQNGVNSLGVDLFEPLHARKVLTLFGRALGQLDNEPLPKQQQFLKKLVGDMSAMSGSRSGDKVICVQLAMFAHMMRGREWNIETIHSVGGLDGLGERFLDELFGPSSPPENRRYREPARAILQALLPPLGAEIKGEMRDKQFLSAKANMKERPQELEKVIALLDEQMLITPADPAFAPEDSSESRTAADRTHYQLTHDYLVPSIRAWLTRHQRQSLRGRAELKLVHRTNSWRQLKEGRFLPSTSECLQITVLTNRQQWNAAQREMMTRAWRRAGTKVLFSLMACLALWSLVSSSRKSPVETFTDRSELTINRIESLSRVDFSDPESARRIIAAAKLEESNAVLLRLLRHLAAAFDSGNADKTLLRNDVELLCGHIMKNASSFTPALSRECIDVLKKTSDASRIVALVYDVLSHGTEASTEAAILRLMGTLDAEFFDESFIHFWQRRLSERDFEPAVVESSIRKIDEWLRVNATLPHYSFLGWLLDTIEVQQSVDGVVQPGVRAHIALRFLDGLSEEDLLTVFYTWTKEQLADDITGLRPGDWLAPYLHATSAHRLQQLGILFEQRLVDLVPLSDGVPHWTWDPRLIAVLEGVAKTAPLLRTRQSAALDIIRSMIIHWKQTDSPDMLDTVILALVDIQPHVEQAAAEVNHPLVKSLLEIARDDGNNFNFEASHIPQLAMRGLEVVKTTYPLANEFRQIVNNSDAGGDRRAQALTTLVSIAMTEIALEEEGRLRAEKIASIRSLIIEILSSPDEERQLRRTALQQLARVIEPTDLQHYFAKTLADHEFYQATLTAIGKIVEERPEMVEPIILDLFPISVCLPPSMQKLPPIEAFTKFGGGPLTKATSKRALGAFAQLAARHADEKVVTSALECVQLLARAFTSEGMPHPIDPRSQVTERERQLGTWIDWIAEQ